MIYTSTHNNEDIAYALDQISILLEVQQASPFRINAYKKAAQSIRNETRPIEEIFEKEGRAGLIQLPAIGKSIGSALEEYLHTGKIDIAERMEKAMTPEELFMMVPGIGDSLAKQISQELKIQSLEELEMAAHDGRLEAMEGFGSRRTRAVQQQLEVMLKRSARLRAIKARKRHSAGKQLVYKDPEVSTLFKIDTAYRAQAKAGKLPKIAPRRFNPDGKAWLPVMHTELDGWLFTAMYSNTARAHELGRTHDWVVIFFEKQGTQYQCTAVTEWQGSQAGNRVIRGREIDCMNHYRLMR